MLAESVLARLNLRTPVVDDMKDDVKGGEESRDKPVVDLNYPDRSPVSENRPRSEIVAEVYTALVAVQVAWFLY